MTEEKSIDYTGMNVYKKVSAARMMLQAIEVKKSGKNDFAKFNYSELADFLPDCNRIFDEVGLCPVFKLLPDKATLDIVNSDKPDEVLTFESPVAEANTKGCTPIQCLGSQHTYLRRYLYMEAMEIVEHDSLDSQVGSDKLVTAEEQRKANEKAATLAEQRKANDKAIADGIKAVQAARRACSEAGVDVYDTRTQQWLMEHAKVQNIDPTACTLDEMKRAVAAYNMLTKAKAEEKTKKTAKAKAEQSLGINDTAATF